MDREGPVHSCVSCSPTDIETTTNKQSQWKSRKYSHCYHHCPVVALRSSSLNICPLVRPVINTVEHFMPCVFTGGVMQKTDELDTVLRENNVDIACVTETWLKESTPCEVVISWLPHPLQRPACSAMERGCGSVCAAGCPVSVSYCSQVS